MLKAQSAILFILRELEVQVDRQALKGPPVYAILTHTFTMGKKTPIKK